jgi:hypothetical protein
MLPSTHSALRPIAAAKATAKIVRVGPFGDIKGLGRASLTPISFPFWYRGSRDPFPLPAFRGLAQGEADGARPILKILQSAQVI